MLFRSVASPPSDNSGKCGFGSGIAGLIMLLALSVVLRAEISLSHEYFRRVVRGVRGEALKQQHPSPAEPTMNLWFRLRRAVVNAFRGFLIR